MSFQPTHHILNTDQTHQLIADIGQDSFVDALDAYFDELDETLAAINPLTHDLTQLAKQAHSLKSSSRLIGAAALADRALQLETHCKQGLTDTLGEQCRQLETCIEQTRQQLKQQFQPVSTQSV